VSDDEYRDLLTKSGLMKLRATSLLAYGDVESRFEAVVLLHDAVRLEDRAFGLLSNPDQVSKLRHAVERWACFIDSLDPVNAKEAWERVKVLSRDVDPDTRRALRARIEPRWAAMSRAFERALKKAPVLFSDERFSMLLSREDLDHQAQARIEVARLLEEYPGVAQFWHWRCHLDNLSGDVSGAWNALQRFVRLLFGNESVGKLTLSEQYGPRSGGVKVDERVDKAREAMLRLGFADKAVERATSALLAVDDAPARADRPITIPEADHEAGLGIGAATVFFGLVAIPIKLYTAISPQSVDFKSLNQELARFDRNSFRINIREFVPAVSVDPVYIESTYYLCPDKRGDRAYALLAGAMARTSRVAIGLYGERGEERLAMLRPHEGGIVMHQLHFAEDIRSIDESIGVKYLTDIPLRPVERRLADQLIAEMSVDMLDSSRRRVRPDVEPRAAWAQPSERHVATQPTASAVTGAPSPKVIDLSEWLASTLQKTANDAARRSRKRSSGR
jgi:Ku protein